MTNIKVVNAGNCIICGGEIKIVTRKKHYKFPNILFCQKCDELRLKRQANKEIKESEVKE